MDIVVIGDDDDHQDIDDDSDFISTEHVSLTKELQQQQSRAVEELENILGEFVQKCNSYIEKLNDHVTFFLKICKIETSSGLERKF